MKNTEFIVYAIIVSLSISALILNPIKKNDQPKCGDYGFETGDVTVFDKKSKILKIQCGEKKW